MNSNLKVFFVVTLFKMLEDYCFPLQEILYSFLNISAKVGVKLYIYFELLNVDCFSYFILVKKIFKF